MTNSIRIVAGRLLQVGRAGLLACTVMAGLFPGCTRGTDDQSAVIVHPSVMVPFEDLFTPEDTLVLDPSVIVGQISFMDFDVSGNLLITDEVSNLVHLFASTGQHQVTYIMDICLPIDGEHRV